MKAPREALELVCEKCGHLNIFRGHTGQYEKSLRTLPERFALRVERRGANECWPWTRLRNNMGYGIVFAGGRRMLAHRVAYQLEHGEIPRGLHILHSCDNRGCCNPRHLRPGTHSENMRDCVARGRHKPPGLGKKGELSPSSKITMAIANSMRAEYRRRVRGHGIPDLARKYGVGKALVHAVVTGKRWV